MEHFSWSHLPDSSDISYFFQSKQEPTSFFYFLGTTFLSSTYNKAGFPCQKFTGRHKNPFQTKKGILILFL
jgi:hypothetical protein